MPNWQHTSATSSPRATSAPTFQVTGPLGKNNGFNTADVFAACAEPTPDNQYTTFKPTRTHWFEGIFFRSAHVLARREPQCPTRASVPDEGLSARREQVRASPTRSPHGPPHDSPHTEADLRRIDGLQFPIQWKTSIWYAFAAYAEPTPDNQYTTPPPHSTTCVCRLRGTNSQQPVPTSTPHHLLIPPHALAAYAEPTLNNQYTAVTFS